MNWSYPIGRVGGTELKVHATFFLLLVWVTVAAWIAGGPAEALVNVAFILAVFACVVLHEFGHALMARRFGVRTPDITLLPIGGMARLERIPENPRQEILIALAGPAVNVVIWAVLSAVIGLRLSMDALGALEDPGQGFLARIATVNLLLVVFNLIPAFPMDGGRVFRALLALVTDRARATQIAARVGQVMAFLFGFVGLTGGNPILLLIAVFIFLAAGAESADATLRETAVHAHARDTMITDFLALSPEDSLETAANAVVRTTQSEFPVLDPSRRLLGILRRNEILTTPEAARGNTRVGTVMVKDIPSVKLNAPMHIVLDAMAQAAAPGVGVHGPDGVFLGYITRENIGEWYLLHRR